MSPVFAYLFAAVMVVLGVAFIWMILRTQQQEQQRGIFHWVGVGLSVVLVLFGFLLAGLAWQVEERAAQQAAGALSAGSELTGMIAPSFTFKTVQDQTERTLDQYQGQVVLINFWATWCAPCLEELPDLNALHDAYKDDGLVILAISDEQPKTIQYFERETPMQMVSGYVDQPERLPQPFREMLSGRPMTFVVDRQGVVQDAVLGKRDFAYFESVVKPLLSTSIADNQRSQ